MIRRAFADLPNRQMHYRHAGEGAPLLMLHASPGSSKQLESKIGAIARNRRVIAPDTPGNGDSSPLDVAAPSIVDYAAGVVEFLDAVGVERCDVYGSHTGAHIAIELGILAPTRVGKVILDGVGVYPEDLRRHYLANYAPPMTPTLDGAYLIKAFMFCRDQYVFWPWFEKAARNRRDGGLPSAEAMHDWVLEVLKSLTTYHLAYGAAFAHVAEDRLGLMDQDVMFLAGANDPLLEDTRRAASLVERGRLHVLGHSADAGFDDTLAAAVETFIGRPHSG